MKTLRAVVWKPEVSKARACGARPRRARGRPGKTGEIYEAVSCCSRSEASKHVRSIDHDLGVGRPGRPRLCQELVGLVNCRDRPEADAIDVEPLTTAPVTETEPRAVQSCLHSEGIGAHRERPGLNKYLSRPYRLITHPLGQGRHRSRRRQIRRMIGRRGQAAVARTSPAHTRRPRASRPARLPPRRGRMARLAAHRHWRFPHPLPSRCLRGDAGSDEITHPDFGGSFAIEA